MFQQPPQQLPEEPQVSPEPQVFVVEDCIVMILKPVDFYRKKSEIARGGPNNLQVFTNFEGCLTRFKTDDGAPAYSSAELLEESAALAPAAVAALRALASEFDNRMPSADEEGGNIDGNASSSFEEYTSKCHQIIAREGQLHLANVAPAVRAMLPFMPFRDAWRECFELLTTKGVPTYVFSSGYGDVVAQVKVTFFSFFSLLFPPYLPYSVFSLPKLTVSL